MSGTDLAALLGCGIIMGIAFMAFLARNGRQTPATPQLYIPAPPTVSHQHFPCYGSCHTENGSVYALVVMTDERLNDIEDDLDEHDGRLDGLDGRVDSVYDRVAATARVTAQAHSRITEIMDHVVGLESLVASMRERLDYIEARPLTPVVNHVHDLPVERRSGWRVSRLALTVGAVIGALTGFLIDLQPFLTGWFHPVLRTAIKLPGGGILRQEQPQHYWGYQVAILVIMTGVGALAAYFLRRRRVTEFVLTDDTTGPAETLGAQR